MNNLKKFLKDKRGNAGQPFLIALGATLVVSLLMLLVVPIIMESAHKMDLTEALGVLTEEGYVVYGAPSGDWTTMGDLYSQDLWPQSDSTYNLGSNATRYSNVYADSYTGPVGRSTTYVIAASDADSREIAQADLVLSTNPGAAINAALTALGTYKSITFVGRTITLEAAITPLAGQTLITKDKTILQGVNRPITISSVAEVTIDGFELNGADTYADGIYLSAATKTKIINCWVHDYSTYGINSASTGTSGANGLSITGCRIYDIGADYTAASTGYGIYLASGSEYTIISNCYINTCGIGIRNEANNNTIIGCNANTNYNGISVTGARCVIDSCYANHCINYGMSFGNGASNGSLLNSHILHCNQEGLSIIGNCYHLIISNNTIYSNGELDPGNDHDCEIRMANIASGNTYVEISNNQIGDGSDADASYGVYFTTATFNNKIINNVFTNSAGYNHYVYGWTTAKGDMYGNTNIIAPGEVKTYSGTITSAADHHGAIISSLDNPFGQAVRITKISIEITTQAGAAATLDVGLSAANNDDPATKLFTALPLNPGTTYPYLYNSLSNGLGGTAQGTQTDDVNWATGSGNRYLNFFNPSGASDNSAVWTYTVTVMGN